MEESVGPHHAFRITHPSAGYPRGREALTRRLHMKSIAMAAALLVTAMPVEAAPDDTYTVKVTVSGMS